MTGPSCVTQYTEAPGMGRGATGMHDALAEMADVLRCGIGRVEGCGNAPSNTFFLILMVDTLFNDPNAIPTLPDVEI